MNTNINSGKNKKERLEGTFGNVIGGSHFVVITSKGKEILCRLHPDNRQKRITVTKGWNVTATIGGRTHNNVHLLINVRSSKPKDSLKKLTGRQNGKSKALQ